MDLDPKSIENRNYGVIALTGGVDLRESKAVVRPGTLQDCLNYEVTSKGYTRAQGLLQYNGTFDSAVETMWWVSDIDANSTIYGPGNFTLGGRVEWYGGSGTCVYWKVDAVNSYKALGVVDIVGKPPDEAGSFHFYDLVSGTGFLVTITPQPLDSARYPHSNELVVPTVTTYLSFINALNTEICAQTSETWPYYKPRPLGVGGITGGFQFKDNIYVARDYVGCGFSSGENDPSIGDYIYFDQFTGKVSQVELFSGSWEAGDATGVIYFEPNATATNDVTNFLNAANGIIITNTTQAAETVGLLDISNHRNKGHLWRSNRAGWSWIDPGYSIRFKSGANAPSAQVAPLFLPNVDDITSPVRNTGFVLVTSTAAVGDTGQYSAFFNVGNITADDASNASTTIAASGASQLIECARLNYVDASNTDIIGVEVEIQASQTIGTDAYIKSVRLVNDSPTAPQYISDNVSVKPTLTTTPALYTFGGQVDLWGMKSISVEDLNSGAVKAQIQFGNNNTSSTRVVNVDYVKIKVHYISRGQTLYFNNGTTDVSKGDVYSFEVHDGDWVDTDATGYMTLHSVTSPKSITSGLTMYTAANKGGVIVAVTAGDITKNLLPSEAELAEESSKWRTIDANFWQNDEGKAVYGCTGASPAFMFDVDEHFAYIRPPIAKDKDKPRHVSFLANHLLLGLISGHALMSAVDVPNDFDPAGTATTWPFRDPITGMTQLAGSTVGVICRESISVLTGTQAPVDTASDPIRTQNVTPKAGGIEYTLADVIVPMFADYNGVTTIETTGKFGDFEAGRLTYAIEPWTRGRLQHRPSNELADRGPVMAIPVRSKNQYRLYFQDGWILSLYVGGMDQPPQPMFGHMDTALYSDKYVPTWIDSSVLSTGRERIVMGDKEGNVWIVDGANGIQTPLWLEEVNCYIVTNPINTGYPQGAHKTYNLTVLGDFMAAQSIDTSVGYDYLPVSSTPRIKTIGNYADPPIFTPQTNYTDVYVDVFTDGASFKIQTSMDGSQPHTLHTLIHRFSRKGSGRNNTTINRG